MDNVDYADPGSWNAYAYAYVYAYSYNQAGRVTLQQMGVLGAKYSGNSMSLAAAYTWDNEGRMTSLQYPTGYMPYGPYHLPTAGYTLSLIHICVERSERGDGPAGERAGKLTRGVVRVLPVWGRADEHGRRARQVRHILPGLSLIHI